MNIGDPPGGPWNTPPPPLIVGQEFVLGSQTTLSPALTVHCPDGEETWNPPKFHVPSACSTPGICTITQNRWAESKGQTAFIVGSPVDSLLNHEFRVEANTPDTTCRFTRAA